MPVDLCAPGYGVGSDGGATKGTPTRMFARAAQANGTSDRAVDVRQYNAVNVAVYASGASPSATILVDGSDEEGGNYLELPDPNHEQAITASVSFDVIAGTAWARVRITNYVSGQFVVICTPFRSPGTTQVQITNTTSQNLAQYVGATVGPGNPVDVRETDGNYATATPYARDVGTSSDTVLAANSSRLYALLVNDSDTDIYISPGGTAAANTGIRLNALGGAYEISRPGGNLYTGAITAIHGSTGTKKLLVIEGT